ncbi:TPA: glycosyltransferase [Photobacterium damselae]
MKVLFIITGLGLGGAEKQVCSLADEIVQQGGQVSIISLSGDTIVRPNNINVNIIELNMKKSFFSLIFTIIKAIKIIKKIKPDVVHSHMIHANIFSRILRVFIKFPKLINSAHSNNEGGKIRMLAYRLTDRLTDLTTNVSNDATDIFINKKAVPKNKILTMPNGIDTDLFTFSIAHRKDRRNELNLSNDAVLYLAVGRLCEPKDYPNMLKAFSLLTNENRYLAIIGIGDLKNSLDLLCDELGISSKVIFLGMKNNINEWMCASDVYVMSSKWEGLPLVIAEAMSSSCYIVATDCGGIGEMLSDCGILVPHSDPISLSNAMSNALLLSDKEKESDAIKVRNIAVDKYSISNVVSMWLRLYKRL